LRNLDGVTLTMRPLDDLDEVLEFVSGLTNLRGYRRQVLGHSLQFIWRYRRKLSPLQLFASMMMAALTSTEAIASSPTRFERRPIRPTYFGPTQPLDACYRPQIRLPASYEWLFDPVRVTDDDGALHPDIAEDILFAPVRRPADRLSSTQRRAGNDDFDGRGREANDAR
jgi:hypothetical protein